MIFLVYLKTMKLSASLPALRGRPASQVLVVYTSQPANPIFGGGSGRQLRRVAVLAGITMYINANIYQY